MEVSPNCVYSSSFKTWFLELGLGQNRRGDFYIGINRVLSLKTFILKKKQNVMKCAKIEREENVKFYRYFHIWYLIKKKKLLELCQFCIVVQMSNVTPGPLVFHKVWKVERKLSAAIICINVQPSLYDKAFTEKDLAASTFCTKFQCS